MKSIPKAKWDETGYKIPVLGCSGKYATLIWKDDETFDDVLDRYPCLNCNYVELRQCVGDIKLMDECDIGVYEFEEEGGDKYFLIAYGGELYHPLGEGENWVCLEYNKFNLVKFYIEYFLPFRKFLSRGKLPKRKAPTLSEYIRIL